MHDLFVEKKVKLIIEHKKSVAFGHEAVVDQVVCMFIKKSVQLLSANYIHHLFFYEGFVRVPDLSDGITIFIGEISKITHPDPVDQIPD